MLPINATQKEIVELRAELERLRRRELDDLLKKIETLTVERDHFRDEAERNAQLGREIAQEADTERQALLSQIAAFRSAGLKPQEVENERITTGLGRANGN